MWDLVDEVDKLDKSPVYQKHEGIEVGDFVEISDPIRRGSVKFIGATDFGGPDKIWYGIELKKPHAKSRTDGTVQGVKYFETSTPKTGVFVLRSKIAKVLRSSAYTQLMATLSKVKNLDEFSKKIRNLRRILDSHCFSSQGFSSQGRSRDFKALVHKGALGSRPSTIPEVKYSIELSSIDSDEEELESPDESKAPIIRESVMSLPLVDESSPMATDNTSKPEFGRSMSDGGVKSLDVLKEENTIPLSRVSATVRSEIIDEIQNDPMMMAISESAKANLNSRASLLNLIADLQRCTNLIDYHLPRVTEQLQKVSDDKIYATNVIQELLKRVQKEQKSTKIRGDFQDRKSLALDSNTEYKSDDIDAMVNVMAWMRNNIQVSALVDENDAKMSSMGAAEVRDSLIRILLQVTEENERAPLKEITMKRVQSDNLTSPGQSRSASRHLVRDLVGDLDVRDGSVAYNMV
jgi:hypothetical protein